MTGCKRCDKPLGPRNVSGYCRKHYSAAEHQNADHGAKISRALKLKYAHDPVFAERAKETARANLFKASGSKQTATRLRLWEIGLPFSLAPEVRARAARTHSERRMAWCPRELREDYRRLVYSKKLRAAEAREIILAQHEKDMATFRKSLGYAA